MTDDGRPIRWGAWRVEEDGAVRVMLVREGASGPEREKVRFAGLEEAADRLGGSFRDVVQRAIAEGHRSGRWRP